MLIKWIIKWFTIFANIKCASRSTGLRRLSFWFWKWCWSGIVLCLSLFELKLKSEKHLVTIGWENGHRNRYRIARINRLCQNGRRQSWKHDSEEVTTERSRITIGGEIAKSAQEETAEESCRVCQFHQDYYNVPDYGITHYPKEGQFDQINVGYAV